MSAEGKVIGENAWETNNGSQKPHHKPSRCGTLGNFSLGGSETGTGQDWKAGVFGEGWVGETELAEKENGVAGGSNFARVHAGGAQAGVFRLFLGLVLLLCDGHFMCADRNSSDSRAMREDFHILR
jgi:hypothetical protein